MFYLLGLALMAASLFTVRTANRAANRPSTPRWVRAAVLGNTVALTATIFFAVGLATLLQAGISQGSYLGFALAGALALLPFAGLWLLAREPSDPAAAEEVSGLPPTSGGHPRRGRTDARLSETAGEPAASRRAG